MSFDGLGLAVIGLASAVLALGVSAYRTIAKTRAEERFLHRLRVASRRDLQSILGDLTAEQKDLDQVYARLLRQVSQSLSGMEQSDQKRIREGLEQPSAHGRRRYLDKLVSEATRSEFSATPSQARRSSS